jgi:hypothetical protein
MRWCLFLLLFLLPAGAALAQGAIHRCVDANGNPVFTDRTCASLHATPVTPGAPADTAPAAVVAAPPATLCAASMDSLKQAVVEAFAARDPNRLAGLMLWGGYGSHAVVADIRTLGQLMRQPLLGIRVVGGDAPPDDAWDGAAPAVSSSVGDGDGDDAASPSALVLSTAAEGGGAPQRTYFQVTPRAGCLWLRPAG